MEKKPASKAAKRTSAAKKGSKSRAKPKKAVSDATVASSVTKAIAKLPLFKNMEIRVAAKSGVVTLTGTSSANFKNSAGRAARSVSSVKSLSNKIVVPQASLGCDEGETECYCNGVITCIPMDQQCSPCVHP